MPKQTLVSNKVDKTISCKNLNYGELGEIVGGGGYSGSIMTKMFTGYVCVYSNNSKIFKSFETTWDKSTTFQVRLLSPEEKVILEND